MMIDGERYTVNIDGQGVIRDLQATFDHLRSVQDEANVIESKCR